MIKYTQEDGTSYLTVPYMMRTDRINKCYQTAKVKNLPVFAMVSGGYCFSGDFKGIFTEAYSDCGSDGTGSSKGMSVYEIMGKSL